MGLERKMKKLIYAMIIFSLSCKRAILNHPAEGAGGLIIGIGIKQQPSTPNSISLSNVSDTINEGDELKIGVKFSQQTLGNSKIKISSSDSAISIDSKSESELSFTAENATTEQSIILKAVPDANKISENVNITFVSEGILTKQISIQIKDNISRNIIANIPSATKEQINSTATFLLGIKPQPDETVTVNLTTDSSYAILTPSSIQFNSENYNIPQKVSLLIDDIYNDNRNYKIIATSDEETVSKTTELQDNDFQSNLMISDELIGITNYRLNPTIGWDRTNDRLVIATRDDSNNGNLRIFKIEGKMTSAPINFAPLSAQRPKIAIDPVTSIVYIHAGFSSNFYPIFFRCSVSPTVSCANKLITSNSYFSLYPKTVIYYSADLSYSKIISIVSDIYGSNVYLLKMNLDLTIDSIAGIGAISNMPYPLGSRGLVYNSQTNSFYSVFTGNTSNYSNTLTVLKIDFNLSSNFQRNLTTSNQGITPDLAIDSANSQLLVAFNDYSQNGIPVLTSFDLNTMTVNYTKLINNGKLSSSYFPKINVDTVNNKILIIAYDNDKKLFLYHCDLKGLNCAVTDVSFGFSVRHDSAEANFDAVVDYKSNRLWVVFTEASSGRPYLTSIGLGGF